MLFCFLGAQANDASSTDTSCSKSYVVVGAGGGGAPMAYGLAMAGCEVTVVERGPDDNWEGSTIFGTPYDLWNWETSWMYQSTFPCAAPIERSSTLPHTPSFAHTCTQE